MNWPGSKKRRKLLALLVEQRNALVKARYDAAQTTSDNRKHWLMADSLSADAGMSASIRRTIRNRARYEVNNNTFAKGMLLTLANDCVGTGPRIQVRIKDNDQVNSLIELHFGRWAREIGLPQKLRTMEMSKRMDGETFAVKTTNPKLASPVKMNIIPIEADRICTPDGSTQQNNVDGIVFDEFRNVESYTVLKIHPGSQFGAINDFQTVPASQMVHWFRPDRPEQHRGLSEITSALPLFAQLRRYTLAVLAAAETAADFAIVAQTTALPEADPDGEGIAPFDVADLEKRLMTFLPEGYTLGQVKPEQPTTGYKEFTTQILAEIARCLNIPLNVALGSSNDASYASGRMDWQTYLRSIGVEQCTMINMVLDSVFDSWVAEAQTLPEFAIFRDINILDIPRQWFFDGSEHVDPLKEAKAQEVHLNNNTTTLANVYGLQGKDWEQQIEQRSREQEKLKELGLESVTTPAAKNDTDDLNNSGDQA